jgi:putative endonuclease
MEKNFCVYILANKIYGTFYVGVTSDLPKRIGQRLKRWERKWKIELIQKQNPDWKDLYEDIL